MSRSKLLAVFAWYFDLVLIESVVWPLHDLVEFNEGPLYHFSVFFRVVVFVLTIVYHVKWKDTAKWLSPGEYLTGQRLISGQKEGVKIFSIHRTFMFVVLLVNMLCTAKTMDVSYYDIEVNWIVLLINYAFNFLLLFGTYKLSEARIEGLLAVILALGFMTGNHALNYFSLDVQPARNMFILYLLLTLANVAVYSYYTKHKSTDQMRISMG